MERLAVPALESWGLPKYNCKAPIRGVFKGPLSLPFFQPTLIFDDAIFVVLLFFFQNVKI